MYPESQKMSGSMLKRCKAVIQQLQNELARITKQNAQKENLIDIITGQKNYFINQNKQNQSLINQLKNANQALRNEIVSVKNNSDSQDLISQLKQELQKQQKLLHEKNKRMKQLEDKIHQQQSDRARLDEQWETLLSEVNNKIKILENQSSQKQQHIYHLEMMLQTKKCPCEETVKQIKLMNHTLQNKYKQLEKSSPIRKNIPTKPIEEDYQRSPKLNKQVRQTRSSAKITSTYRPRINNSAYMNNVPIPLNPQKSEKKGLPFLISQKTTNSSNKPAFFYETFERNIIDTRRNLQKQYEKLNVVPSIDKQKIQRTLRELEAKINKAVKKIQHSQSQSCIE